MSPLPSIAEVLRFHFEARQAKRPGYSIRAFARDLKLSPAFLSQVLSSKRLISPGMAEHISKTLKLNSVDRDYLIAQAISNSSRSKNQKELATLEVVRLQEKKTGTQMSKDEFAIISEWHHLAIFQSLFLKRHARASLKYGEADHLSRFLKVPTPEVTEALQRLKKLNFITFNGSHHTPNTDLLVVDGEVPSAAIRKYHRQIIQKSLVAMEAQPIEQRVFNTTTLSIRKADLPELRKEYEKFYQKMIRQFSKRAEDEIEADSIYAISTQFFSLSHQEAS